MFFLFSYHKQLLDLLSTKCACNFQALDLFLAVTTDSFSRSSANKDLTNAASAGQNCKQLAHGANFISRMR